MQPTPEQMRLAQMITDKNDIEDPVLQAKVKQVCQSSIHIGLSKFSLIF